MESTETNTSQNIPENVTSGAQEKTKKNIYPFVMHFFLISLVLFVFFLLLFVIYHNGKSIYENGL
ncbi:MAG: hypothetical protein KBC21_01740 [Candidatus Pacebacteria bacterium]|nr:hypothetical protein [Candidatus Paceibacterota bacterium]